MPLNKNIYETQKIFESNKMLLIDPIDIFILQLIFSTEPYKWHINDKTDIFLPICYTWMIDKSIK